MLTVWKFVVEVLGEQGVMMPQGARLLAVHAQDERTASSVLWALVDPKAPKVCRHIAVRGTGHDVEPELATGYVGTAWCWDLGETG